MTTITLTYADFAANFPEFADSIVYPEPAYNFWRTIAVNSLNASRFGDLSNLGASLFIAHNLVLEAQAQQSASNGAIPGVSVGGPISGKSVDKVSINYDTTAAMEIDAGHWNLTIYGKRLIRMMRMFGAGGLQVGAGAGFVDPLSSGNAWPGPDVTPGFTNF